MKDKKGCEICRFAQSKAYDYCSQNKDFPEVICEHFVDRRDPENLPIYGRRVEPAEVDNG